MAVTPQQPRQTGCLEAFLRSYRRLLGRLEESTCGVGDSSVSPNTPEPALSLTPAGSRTTPPPQNHRVNTLVLRRLLLAFLGERADAGAPPGSSGEPPVPPEAMALLERELILPFDFLLAEDGLRSNEAAIDPEILSRLHEAQVGGRHESGSYYTPKPVVSFMARRALEDYLERSLPDETPASLRRLVWGLDPGGLRAPLAALEAVVRVKLCDPACGCGAFLMGAMQLLLGLRRCLSTAAETAPFHPYLARMEILRHNLHGVDIDPGAVEIARLRLWLSSLPDQGGAAAHPPPTFAPNIRLADSLVGIDWPATFPAPFAASGFDVVVMNPPYLLSSRVPGHDQQRFREYADRLRSRYGFADDLYVHFLHLGLGLLREGGILCAISSSSFLTNSRKEPLRRELLRHTLRLLMPLGPQLFPAVVYSAITVARRGRTPRPDQPILYANLRREDATSLADPERIDRLSIPVPRDEYERAFGALFFEPTPAHRYLFGTLLADTPTESAPTRSNDFGRSYPVSTESPTPPGGTRLFVRLGEVAPALDTGIHSGNVRHRLFYRDPAPGLQLHRLLQGTQLLRYGVWWEHPEARYRYVDVGYHPDPERKGIGRGGKPSGRVEYWHFCGPAENHHVAERLLMRQTGDDPFVGYLFQGQERIYTDNTLHTLLLADLGRQLGLTYRYLLALLNSSTLRWVYRALAQEEGRMLAQVKTAVVNRLPIAIPTQEERTQLERLVARIQALQQESGLPLDAGAAEKVAALQRDIDRLVAVLYRLPQPVGRSGHGHLGLGR